MIVVEEWRAVPHVELLEASNLGKVRSLPYELKMPNGGVSVRRLNATFGHLTVSKSGNYSRRQICFRRKRYMVARLICITFHGLPPFEGAEAMHKNEDSLDNRSDNLEWGTRKENANAPNYLRYCREVAIEHLRAAQ